MSIPNRFPPRSLPRTTVLGCRPRVLPRHGAHAKFFVHLGRGDSRRDFDFPKAGDGQPGAANQGGDAMAGLYFEEFAEGQVFDHAIGRTVTEMDNVLFSTL